MKRNFLLFLYSTPNLVGSLLGLLGLAAFFAGIIKSFWLLIVLGLYAIGFVATPRNRTASLRLKKSLATADIEKGLEELIRKIRKKVSPPILERVVSIKDSISMLMPRLNEMDGSDRNLHIIRQTATDYLPDMLQTYLTLPTSFARLHRIRGQKTPQEILIDQLDILDQEMKQIVIDINSQNADLLIAHGKFLRDKFEKGDSWLD
ncbi:MAG: hypothetical protein ACU85E_17545 [Gammaproteobacteria bacterium]